MTELQHFGWAIEQMRLGKSVRRAGWLDGDSISMLIGFDGNPGVSMVYMPGKGGAEDAELYDPYTADVLAADWHPMHGAWPNVYPNQRHEASWRWAKAVVRYVIGYFHDQDDRHTLLDSFERFAFDFDNAFAAEHQITGDPKYHNRGQGPSNED